MTLGNAVEGRSSSVAQLDSHKDGLRMEFQQAEAARQEHAAAKCHENSSAGVTVNEMRKSLSAYGLAMSPQMLASLPRVKGTDGLIDYNATLHDLKGMHALGKGDGGADDDGSGADSANSSLAILQHGSAEHERQKHLARVKRIREQWREIQIDLVWVRKQ